MSLFKKVLDKVTEAVKKVSKETGKAFGSLEKQFKEGRNETNK